MHASPTCRVVRRAIVDHDDLQRPSVRRRVLDRCIFAARPRRDRASPGTPRYAAATSVTIPRNRGMPHTPTGTAAALTRWTQYVGEGNVVASRSPIAR
jgi:hypothetical protein